MGEHRQSGAGAASLVPPEVLAELGAPMVGDHGVRLEVITEAHRELLRAACAQDSEIWEVYPFSMIDEHFDPAFANMTATPHRIAFAAFQHGVVIGTTSFLAIDPVNHLLEIGGTFFAPSVRGTGYNTEAKRLMIGRAIEAGFTRIELRADARNLRSCAAIAKLGAVKEGVLRKNRITWTGHVRDTAVFSILAGEWAG